MVREKLGYKKEMKNNCLYCLLKNNCILNSIVMENIGVFKLTLGLKSINGYSSAYNDIAKFCKVFVKDDVKELSLPNIDLIEVK